MIKFYGSQLRAIKRFKSLLCKYYSSDELTNEDKETTRSQINMLNHQVRQYVIEANLPLTASKNKGGYIGEDVDIIGNALQIGKLRGATNLVFDLLDMTYGYYKAKHYTNIKRLFNPFYLAGEFIRIPFYIGKFAGFEKIDKIEFSIMGKLWKFFLGMIFFLAAVATILSFVLLVLNELNIQITEFLRQ